VTSAGEGRTTLSLDNDVGARARSMIRLELWLAEPSRHRSGPSQMGFITGLPAAARSWALRKLWSGYVAHEVLPSNWPGSAFGRPPAARRPPACSRRALLASRGPLLCSAAPACSAGPCLLRRRSQVRQRSSLEAEGGELSPPRRLRGEDHPVPGRPAQHARDGQRKFVSSARRHSPGHETRTCGGGPSGRLQPCVNVALALGGEATGSASSLTAPGGPGGGRAAYRHCRPAATASDSNCRLPHRPPDQHQPATALLPTAFGPGDGVWPGDGPARAFGKRVVQPRPPAGRRDRSGPGRRSSGCGQGWGEAG